MKRLYQKWSQEETEKLATLIKDQKLKNSEICKQLKRTYGSVLKKIISSGFQRYHPRNWTQKETKLLTKMVNSRKISITDICQKLKRSQTCVFYIIRKLGLVGKNSFCYANVNTDNWTKSNIAWLAGFLEGEGCFTLFNHKNHSGNVMAISATSTDLDILQKTKKIAGCGSIFSLKQRENCKPAWIWRVARKLEVYSLFAAIFDFMGNRRKERIKECMESFKS